MSKDIERNIARAALWAIRWRELELEARGHALTEPLSQSISGVWPSEPDRHKARLVPKNGTARTPSPLYAHFAIRGRRKRIVAVRTTVRHDGHGLR